MIHWIASYPKSGNTWVRLFLNAYHFGFADINLNNGFTRYDAEEYHWKALTLGVINENVSIYCRPAVLYHIVASRRFSDVFMKTHWANVSVDGITAFPSTMVKKSVYLIRDPRDVCVSFARHIGKTIDYTIAEMSHAENILMSNEGHVAQLTSWSRHVTSWEKPNVTFIKYEELKKDPEAGFTNLLNAYGVEPNKDKLKKAIDLCDIENLKKQEEEKKFIEIGKQDKFFGQGKGWKNELTEKQARRIVEDHSEVMEKYGYI